MHFDAGAHAAPHARHAPSDGVVHCLYERDAASYMQPPAGVHVAPK